MVKRRESWLVPVLATVVVVANAAITLVTAVVDDLPVPGLIRARPWWWIVGFALVVSAAGAFMWWLQQRAAAAHSPAWSSTLALPPWLVSRPVEADKVVAALRRRKSSDPVAIATGLYGAGGFGKTTLARVVCTDRRVRRHFRSRIMPVTIGRDAREPAAIAAKVNNVIALVAPEENPTFTDPELAGRRLGVLLDSGARLLLFLDDVWFREQLTPFLHGGRRCTRLVTTRIPTLLPGSVKVNVDRMTPLQARQLLTWNVSLDSQAVEDLLTVTGRWPLLLQLANKILLDGHAAGTDPSRAARQLCLRLRTRGPQAVDEITGEAVREPNLDDPEQRHLSVRATVEASTSLLTNQERARFTELAVFVGDDPVPISLVARLWQATAGSEPLAAQALVARLATLALVSTADGAIGMHDEIRAVLRHQIGQPRLGILHQRLLDTVAQSLPTAPANVDRGEITAWWQLSEHDQYLWDHLIEHHLHANRPDQAVGLACDLRWISTRLLHFGPTVAYADLTGLRNPQSDRKAAVFARFAHLLTPTDPAEAVIDILHSRVAEDPNWQAQSARLRDTYDRPRLVNRWPPPDLSHPALRRVLTRHYGLVTAAAISPDGTWLATGSSDDRRVRTWTAATGAEEPSLIGHQAAVTAVAISPDGTWLASGSFDGTVRIWDTTTGTTRAALAAHTGAVTVIAISPDGTWLATASSDEGTLRIWTPTNDTVRTIEIGSRGEDTAIAISSDGTLLTSGSSDQSLVQVWDTTTAAVRNILLGRPGSVTTTAISPDGTWLATGSHDGTLRAWDVATGTVLATATSDQSPVRAIAVAPDGSWLVTGSHSGILRIWEAATWRVRTVLTGHAGPIGTVAISPDGTWLASGGNDETVRCWSTTTDTAQTNSGGREVSVIAMSISPDGTWLATGSHDGTLRAWDLATGTVRATATSHESPVRAVAVAPGGTWLATGSDSIVRLWDAATAELIATLAGHQRRVLAVAVAPDGYWLASGDEGGMVRIWDRTNNSPLNNRTSHQAPVTAIAISTDGTWYATGSEDKTVRIWAGFTGRLQSTRTGHQGSVTTVAISPDGLWLASGSHDKTVRIWDAAHGGLLDTALTGHQGPVTTVAISPDGLWLASGSHDRTVRIWDVHSVQTIAVMRFDAYVECCRWLPDGVGIVVGGPAGLYAFDFLRPRRNRLSAIK